MLGAEAEVRSDPQAGIRGAGVLVTVTFLTHFNTPLQFWGQLCLSALPL